MRSPPRPDGRQAVAIAHALADEFQPAAARYDRTGAFPFVHMRRIRESGLVGLAVSRRDGGPGSGLAVAVGVLRRLGAGDPASALVLAQQYVVHAGLATAPAAAVWARLLPGILAGQVLVNALRVEPELGTPARGGLPATVARRVAGGWRIDGHKIYATGIPALNWLILWARTDEAEPRVGYWLVAADAPGIAVRRSWDHLGMRATRSDDVLLEDVFVPADHAWDLRPPAEWLTGNPPQAAWNALAVTAVYQGVAKAAQDWLMGYLGSRTPSNLGRPLATLDRFQDAAGEIAALVHAGDRIVDGEAAAFDADPDAVDVVSLGLAKLTATRNAIRAAQITAGLVGNPGLSRGNPLERHLRDVLCARVHTPQDDSILRAAGRRALGV